MQSHDNYTWIVGSLGRRFGLGETQDYGKQRVLSYLPLSHVAAQVLDLVLCLKFGISVTFPDASALQANLGKFLLICKP